MKLFGYNLDYENSYQKWSFLISHKLFKREGERYIEMEGEAVEVDDEVALHFEKIFSRYLKIAYVDILNADRADLKVSVYYLDEPAIMVHKVVWRHLDNKVTYIVYDVSSGEPPQHLEEPECRELLSVFGIPIF